MMKTKRKGNGFTLIELLVTMAIMVGVVFAAGGAIVLLTRTMDTTNQLTNDNSAARLSMMRLTREARSATRVEIKKANADGTDLVGGSGTESEAQNLYLHFATGKKLVVDAHDEEMWQEEGTVVLYYRNHANRQLRRVEGTYTAYFTVDDEGEESLQIFRSMNDASGVDTGLTIRRFSTRIDFDERGRGWLYIRIRADQAGDAADSLTYDQNLMVDTKIALSRLIT